MEVFTFKNEEKTNLEKLLQHSPNPYSKYMEFKSYIELNVLPNISSRFQDFCKKIVESRKNNTDPVSLIKNCPLDAEIPLFNHDNPVMDKYEKKKTFISEAFLQLFNDLTETPVLAYTTRNNGDFFHDVYAYTLYSNTQTQKTDGELFLHNDRTAHPVRADYLALLGMRCSKRNKIYTGYIHGTELLKYLSRETQKILREKYFCTPYDEYSKDSNDLQDVSHKHYILEEESCFRYYDTRTRPLEDAPIEAYRAILNLKDAFVKAKKERVIIEKGELLSFPNQAGLHCRDIIEIEDYQEAKDRWLLKTYSFRGTDYAEKFKDTFDAKIPYLIRDNSIINEF